jgi:hypothetical protein
VGTLIVEANFEDLNVSPSVDWNTGTVSGGTLTVSNNTTLNYGGSAGSIKGTYPYPSNDSHCYLTYEGIGDLSLYEVYINFRAKMPSAYKGGLKFCKLFGVANNGYANVTFGPNYADGNRIRQVAFGDGVDLTNDTQSLIMFDGTTTAGQLGRNYGIASIYSPQNAAFTTSMWGTDWHHFRFYVKFNSGTTAQNEVPDGRFYVEIDGNIYLDASNIFNRHYSNGPINKVGFFNYAQSNSDVFELWYDDIKISRDGWV